jgi:hypothetical protein
MVSRCRGTESEPNESNESVSYPDPQRLVMSIHLPETEAVLQESVSLVLQLLKPVVAQVQFPISTQYILANDLLNFLVSTEYLRSVLLSIHGYFTWIFFVQLI